MEINFNHSHIHSFKHLIILAFNHCRIATFKHFII